ncbi:Rne/Rng family ribonuclease [Azonexus sp.]|jgi:ribonuclease E|uniref:Rne/Rng family ribonuclease n=1 Tax=Azonexus sp. TaxID=1872668 RepID=UPI002826E54D|nr:Rne/Rng family ribonuclease [Azonexus sp.]MDR1996401.1 Rne/Rng family ribonuclease [Azonexus sp.]
MKRMLFNATQAEELRVAIVDGQKLIDLDIESAAKEQRKSNIYKGVITRIEPSLEACFVDYGAERHGFLPFKEISRAFFQPGVEASKAKINEALKEGQELIVQVDKDERGNKGAALTTYVSLAGRYLVLMPNNPRGGGVSRRVDGDERAELREVMDQLEVPNGMSLIARTAAIGRQAEELQWDLNYLLQLWSAIEGAAKQQSGAFLIYLEGSLVIRAIRDYFQPEIGEILIDTDEIYEQAKAFMGTVMPGNVNRVKRYRDDVPLFSRFQIEHQIETAFARQVNLPSGGAIVIDHTEALVAVDVNSGRATKGSDIEETAFKTNLEAAEELARQLRLRDLGGLIVIDFIDMENSKNQREVENRLRDGLRFDRARVQMGKISRFGLMELSRQRLRPALAETSYISCPRCTGTGHIRSTESAALHILRILEEEAMKENTGAVHVQMPVDVATFLLNEKRPDIAAIELRHKVNILLIPNIHLETPAHTITRLRHDDLNNEDSREPSYRMVDAPMEEAIKLATLQESSKPRQEAVVKGISPEQPAPVVGEKATSTAVIPAPQEESGLFAKIASWFRGSPKPAEQPAPAVEPARKPREGRRERGESRGDGRRNGRNGNRRQEERGERQERGNRGERQAERAPRDEAAAPAANSERKERRPRGERRDKTEQRPAQETGENQLPAETASLTTLPAGTDIQEAANGEEGTTRRRGRRGGRGRGEGRRQEGEALAAPVATEESINAVEAAVPLSDASIAAPAEAIVAQLPLPITEEQPIAEPQQAVVIAPAEVVAVQPEHAPAVAEPVQARPAAEPAAAIAAPAIETAAAEAAIAPTSLTTVAATEPASTVAVEEAPASVPVPVVTAAPIAVAAADLEQTLTDSGLVLVQTTTAAVAQQPEPPVRLGRPRKPKADVGQVTDEPLMMVETDK